MEIRITQREALKISKYKLFMKYNQNSKTSRLGSWGSMI
jgi:hypothetical protein